MVPVVENGCRGGEADEEGQVARMHKASPHCSPPPSSSSTQIDSFPSFSPSVKPPFSPVALLASACLPYHHDKQLRSSHSLHLPSLNTYSLSPLHAA